MAICLLRSCVEKNVRFRHSIQAFLAFAQAFEAVMQALEAFHCFQAL